MRYFGAGAGGAPPRHGLWPRPISPFQGAFGRLRLPQRRPAGGGGGQRLSGGCNDGCISTYCHNIYRITIRFALSSAARRAALRPALPAERPLKGGDGPCEAWRGGSPRSKLHQQRIIRTLPRFRQGAPCKGERAMRSMARGFLRSKLHQQRIIRTLLRLRQGAPCKGEGTMPAGHGEGVPTCRKHPQCSSVSSRNLPTHGPPWLWARADSGPALVPARRGLTPPALRAPRTVFSETFRISCN